MIIGYCFNCLHQFNGYPRGAIRRCTALREIQTTAFSQLFLGEARAHLGRPTERVSLIRQGIARLAEIGTRNEGSSQLTIRAEALALSGATAEALETIELVLRPDRPGMPLNRPRALMLRGKLLLKLGQVEMAERDLRESIAVARTIGAKSYDLRATTNLARLLVQQGKREEAQTRLAEIYNWFTEGFGTRDLKDARALLDELAA